MTANIMSTPEAFGLRTIGEAEFSSGAWEFDTSILWQDVETGAFYVADDSGCSCPMPFEGIGRNDLTKVENLGDLLRYLDERKQASYRWKPVGDRTAWENSESEEIDAECSKLVQAYLAAKRGDR